MKQYAINQSFQSILYLYSIYEITNVIYKQKYNKWSIFKNISQQFVPMLYKSYFVVISIQNVTFIVICQVLLNINM